MLAIAGAMALLIGLVGIYGLTFVFSFAKNARDGYQNGIGACRTEVKRIFVAQGFILAASEWAADSAARLS